ncbi:Hypothetical protein NTJ_00403 [Nesidiocoris tenuis]|uniref:Uncharacterized protein n=1 Tax=Nesidiocoris tenuis TaxID=355587 RepID=A0ABN7A5V1_9HEMI|nr:Hypothetical protein NTJ_00403 [Nesidiocoris tenuis]
MLSIISRASASAPDDRIVERLPSSINLFRVEDGFTIIPPPPPSASLIGDVVRPSFSFTSTSAHRFVSLDFPSLFHPTDSANSSFSSHTPSTY